MDGERRHAERRRPLRISSWRNEEEPVLERFEKGMRKWGDTIAMHIMATCIKPKGGQFVARDGESNKARLE